MKGSTIVVTLAVALATCAFAQQQGGPPQGGPSGQRGQGFGGPGGRRGMEGAIAPLDRLVFRADVQEDIKVTADQKSKLDALRPQRGRGGQGGPGGPPPGGQGGGQGAPPPPPPSDQGFGGGQGGPPQGGPGGDPQAMEAQRKKLDEAIKGILSSGQIARVKEIGIHLAGSRAVLDKDIQTQLGITADQKSKIDEVMKSQQESMQSLFEQAQSGNMDREQMMAAIKKNRETLDSKLAAILTSDQGSKLKAMGGQPFKATVQEGPGGPGGPGGPPPRGGGFGGPPPDGN